MRFFEAPPQKLGLFHPITIIATVFWSGLLRPAPGTWGSLAALPFGYLLFQMGGTTLLLVGLIVSVVIGIWASGAYATALGQGDPSSVVIDELSGLWLALLGCSFSLPEIVVAFAAFRVFDILKPWPVGWADREVKGGVGIVADDLIAGVYALIVVQMFIRFF